jgi:cell wall-associated NlpC family hydrolase
MAGYAYRLPRKYRRYGKSDSSGLLAAVAVLVVLLAASGAKAAHGGSPARTTAATAAAVQAIAYAKRQIGLPYCWGGTGGGCYDCSGLVMMAYRTAGVSIARTSQQQWATERHVSASRVQAGDLVFFAGADGTMTDPGHVGIVTGRGTMIEAYGTGYPIRRASYDRPDLVGFTDPRGGAS